MWAFGSQYPEKIERTVTRALYISSHPWYPTQPRTIPVLENICDHFAGDLALNGISRNNFTPFRYVFKFEDSHSGGEVEILVIGFGDPPGPA